MIKYTKINVEPPIGTISFFIILKTYIIMLLIGYVTLYNYGTDLGMDLMEDYFPLLGLILQIELIMLIIYFGYPLLWNLFVFFYKKYNTSKKERVVEK